MSQALGEECARNLDNDMQNREAFPAIAHANRTQTVMGAEDVVTNAIGPSEALSEQTGEAIPIDHSAA